MFFYSLFSKDASHSRGRQMSAHMSDPDRKVLSIVGPVGNSALQAVGVAAEVRNADGKPIVLCSLGDGMTQQGEVLEAIAQAVRDQLPVLFVVQDNRFAISTKTQGRTFYSYPDGEAEAFYGVPLERIDGRDVVSAAERFGDIVERMRDDRRPALVLFQVERLSNHTNADDQRVYRTAEEIEQVAQTSDPVTILGQRLLERGLDRERFDALHEEIRRSVTEQAKRAQLADEPEPCNGAKAPVPAGLTAAESEYRGAEDDRTVTMLEAIREVLRARLAADSRVTLFGEDIADPKGDVFGVTRGLTTQFPGRVENSPLTESTILGVSVGRAMAGGRPVAFLQFADFLPLAYNQVFAELGSLYWRTDGGWRAPVIVMITCGGYKPGLGPFHASSLEALAAHTPGVDVLMPSTAADAAGLLNAAFESERPTLFFYPKNCLNDRQNATSKDVDAQLVPIGRARTVREGSDITVVGWGNTVALAQQAADSLSQTGVQTEIIDLRSLVPWDEEQVLSSVRKTGRLVVAHEDNHTCGFGGEVVATVAEKAGVPVAVSRVTRPDTYVPFNFANQLEVLPSYRRILEACADLVGYDVEWQKPDVDANGAFTVEAIGSSPSDESVTVIEWHVHPGDTVDSGDLLATLEADKAVQELSCPVEGQVEELLVEEGQMVKVGTPIVALKTEDTGPRLKPVTKENPGTPVLRRRPEPNTEAAVSDTAVRQAPERSVEEPAEPASEAAPAPRTGAPRLGMVEVGVASVASAFGSRRVTNEDIAGWCPEWQPDDIAKRTGIETRFWVRDDENALTLGAKALRMLLTKEGLEIGDVDLLLSCSGTPLYTTPSMACLLHDAVSAGRDTGYVEAYDINAACSGYLYALQIAHDYLQLRPDHKVVVVTSETLSQKLDPADPSTAPIFGDAATASLVLGGDSARDSRAHVYRPVLSAKGEDGSILKVPNEIGGQLSMDGPKVFLSAVKDMVRSLGDACTEAGVDVEDLALIVPHQANQRIIEAIRYKLQFPKEKMYSNIRHTGNTSSSSIPLCLERLLFEGSRGDYIGLCAFGGGFTFGGAILRLL